MHELLSHAQQSFVEAVCLQCTRQEHFPSRELCRSCWQQRSAMCRKRCEEAAKELEPKWAKLRQLLSVNQAREDKIKKYCRKVRLIVQALGLVALHG